jgi:hypothetical protein
MLGYVVLLTSAQVCNMTFGVFDSIWYVSFTLRSTVIGTNYKPAAS